MRNWMSAVAVLALLVVALPATADGPANQRSLRASTPMEIEPEESTPVIGGPVAAPPQILPDGRIAVSGPTTITRPGSYLLTRPISGAGGSGPVIAIDADDVTLDLNGFAVERAEAGDGQTIRVEGNQQVVIKNGIVHQAQAVDQAEAIQISGPATVTLHDLRIVGSDSFSETPCVRVVNGPVQLVLTDSHVQGCYEAALGGTLVDSRITGNVLLAEPTDDAVSVLCNDCDINNNLVRGILSVSGSRNTVSRNNIVGGGELILSSGSWNVISENSSSDMYISGSNNLYRGNFSSDFTDDGTDNQSGGDNFLPGPM